MNKPTELQLVMAEISTLEIPAPKCKTWFVIRAYNGAGKYWGFPSCLRQNEYYTREAAEKDAQEKLRGIWTHFQIIEIPGE